MIEERFFKPEYKDDGRNDASERGGREHNRAGERIQTERLRQDYGRGVLTRRDAVGLEETNEGSSNSRRKKRRKSARERPGRREW